MTVPASERAVASLSFIPAGFVALLQSFRAAVCHPPNLILLPSTVCFELGIGSKSLASNNTGSDCAGTVESGQLLRLYGSGGCVQSKCALGPRTKTFAFLPGLADLAVQAGPLGSCICELIERDDAVGFITFLVGGPVQTVRITWVKRLCLSRADAVRPSSQKHGGCSRCRRLPFTRAELLVQIGHVEIARRLLAGSNPFEVHVDQYKGADFNSSNSCSMSAAATASLVRF